MQWVVGERGVGVCVSGLRAVLSYSSTSTSTSAGAVGVREAQLVSMAVLGCGRVVSGVRAGGLRRLGLGLGLEGVCAQIRFMDTQMLTNVAAGLCLLGVRYEQLGGALREAMWRRVLEVLGTGERESVSGLLHALGGLGFHWSLMEGSVQSIARNLISVNEKGIANTLHA